MISRNEPMGTVERTRKNLVYMRNARKAGADIHEVTHLLNSLLGLIVVPWERLQDCGVSRLYRNIPDGTHHLDARTILG